MRVLGASEQARRDSGRLGVAAVTHRGKSRGGGEAGGEAGSCAGKLGLGWGEAGHCLADQGRLRERRRGELLLGAGGFIHPTIAFNNAITRNT